MMTFQSTIRTFVFSILGFSLSASAYAEKKLPYAQLSSLHTQMPSEENRIVKLDKVDGSLNIGVTRADKITIIDPGIYFFAAAGQVGAQNTGESGFVDLWLMHNGKPIANSGARQSVSDAKLTAVLLSQTVMPLEKGDSVGVGFSANKTGLGLIGFPALQSETAIPSIIFTIFKID